MAMYIYQTDGIPVGFRFSNFIHDLDGTPLGRIFGTHVHRLDGSYVGELFKDSVVEKPVPSVRTIQPVAPPPQQPGPGPSYQRRGLVDYGYPDVFHLLQEGAQQPFQEPMAIAAE
ncbi:MAG TPA: hypothetical protein VGW34_03450 [Allosphingosinicella sp.]|nr:hypothetical protein [Allosphingosinicella sp.]